MSPAKGKPSPTAGRRYEREWYTGEEMSALLDRTSGNSPTAARNKALVVLLWQSGLRIAEALDLQPRDVDLARGEVHVRHGKGDKERTVVCGPAVVPAIVVWQAHRLALDLPVDAPLFCTLEGRRLHGTYVRQLLNRLAVAAGWRKRIHPHGLRYTFAVNLARSGVAMPIIQRQLGHESLATTGIYLKAITTGDVTEGMEKVQWG